MASRVKTHSKTPVRDRDLRERGPRAKDRLQGELGAREALFRLLSYLLPLWKIVLVAMLFTVAYSAVNLGYGALVKQFLDLTVPDPKTGISQVRSDDVGKLSSVISLAVLVIIGKTLLYVFMSYSWSYASQRLSLRLRNEVFAHLQNMSIRFYDLRKTGQLMSVLNSDVGSAVSILDTIQDTIQSPLVVIGGVGVLFWLNWPLALVTCTCLPLMALAISKATRQTSFYTTRLQRLRALMSDVAQETISSMRIVKSFANEEHEIQRYQERSEGIFRTLLRTIRLKLLMRLVVELLGAAAIILVLGVGAFQIMSKTSSLTVGGLAMFLIVVQQVTAAARDAGGISVSLSSVAVGADRVFTLLNLKSDVQEKPEAIILPPGKGEVEFDHVSFGYTREFPVLDNVSFSMRSGEVVAIVGPTGAGKTTIASLIPRFYDVSDGSIRVDGVDIRDCTLNSLRNQIGIVPQDTTLFAGPLRDNIAYGRLDATEEEIVAAAQMANAWEFIERLPQGLDTVIGERGVMLSGGQRQRIAIARAVLRDPRILILDEATSALDAHSEALIQDAMQRLVAHRTTLVIAHRLSTIRNADKILVLQGGRVIEMGRHEELLSQNGVYASLYHTQFRSLDGEIVVDRGDTPLPEREEPFFPPHE